MKVNSIKEIKPSNKAYKKVLAVIISLLVIAFSYVIINDSNKAARDTVEVVRIKESDGIPAQGVIQSDNIGKYSIARNEYTKDMIKYEDRKTVIGTYALYFLRDNAILYKDQTNKKEPKKDEWLYNLDKQSEALTLPFNYMECGGDILRPGDNVRVRVSYKVTDTPAAGGVPNYGAIDGTDGKVIKTDVIFDTIKVKDLLNSSGHSIYEVYKEVKKLDPQKRETAMASDEFLQNIQPRSLVLEATPQQVSKYAKCKVADGQVFIITILSRQNNKDTKDLLPTIEKEVESWGNRTAN